MPQALEPNQFLKVRGANEHNLKNVDIDIPKNKLIVMTGVSGSGKSSLAFDTIMQKDKEGMLNHFQHMHDNFFR